MSAIPPDLEPARVSYLEGRRVRVFHRDGPDAENYKITVERLKRRGFRILPPQSAPNLSARSDTPPPAGDPA